MAPPPPPYRPPSEPVPVPRADPVSVSADAARRAPAEAYRRLAEIYRDVDAEIARLAPRCDARGICCDFDRVDHVLFASKLEVDFVKDHAPEARWAKDVGNRCPFLEGGLCTAREIRPLGCRTYFCQEGWEPHGAELYERHYARVKEIAVAFGLEWRYAPVLAQLRDGS
jgi:Fe-S-cluster containining protein